MPKSRSTLGRWCCCLRSWDWPRSWRRKCKSSSKIWSEVDVKHVTGPCLQFQARLQSVFAVIRSNRVVPSDFLQCHRSVPITKRCPDESPTHFSCLSRRHKFDVLLLLSQGQDGKKMFITFALMAVSVLSYGRSGQMSLIMSPIPGTDRLAVISALLSNRN